MHANLATALNILGFNNNPNQAKVTVESLFHYLYIANYLDEQLLNKAVDYLHAEHAFSVAPEQVKRDLSAAIQLATKGKEFSSAVLLDNFAKQDYFQVGDIIDLIVFLQQTAFDRQYGHERDTLQAKSWMAENPRAFIEFANNLGVVQENVPKHDNYIGVGIMGAATFRVNTRIDYFKTLTVQYENVWALSGSRELSKGLDEDHAMEEVAKALDKPLKFVEKPSGTTTRIFLDGVTETEMVNYFIASKLGDEKVGFLDSQAQEGHWRATTKQSAADIAPLLIEKLKAEGKVKEGAQFHFMIIAEQPFSNRMAMQVQRAFQQEIARQKLAISISVEGCGQGIEQKVVSEPEAHLSILTRINSALGALMGERYNSAKASHPDFSQRSDKIIMFSGRDNYFESLKPEAGIEHQAQLP